MNDKKNSSMFAGIILLIASLLAMYWGYILVQEIFVPLLFAVIFSVIGYPAYQWFLRKTGNKIISSLLCCLALVLLVLGLIFFAVYLAVGEVVSLTRLFTDHIDFQKMDFLSDQTQFSLLIDETVKNINQLVSKIPFIDTSFSDLVTDFLKNIPRLLQEVSTYIISFIKISVSSATNWVVDLFIFFISFFFLLIDGRSFAEYTFRLLPINALHERQITKRFSSLCYSWIVVSLLVSFIQGSLAAIGFAIIGVPSPFIWGIITMFASFIPVIGSAIIWMSMAIIYLILGKYGSGIFILIWGATMISSSDNFLRPFLLKEGIKIHPLILFLAVLGGFFAFGVPGLIIGPLIVVFISLILYIYELEFGQVLSQFHGHD